MEGVGDVLFHGDRASGLRDERAGETVLVTLLKVTACAVPGGCALNDASVLHVV